MTMMRCRGERRNERVCHSSPCWGGNSDYRFVSDYFSEDMNNAQIQIPISRHTCLSHGGLHIGLANAVSGVPDLAGGDGMEIIDCKRLSEIPAQITAFEAYRDDETHTWLKHAEMSQKLDLSKVYRIRAEVWIPYRSNDARSND